MTIAYRTFAAAVLLSVASVAQAVTVAGVYNTGVGVGGTPLMAGNGMVDANYTIVGGTAPTAVIRTSAKTYAEFDWFAPDTPAARAINATGSGGGVADTTIIFRTTFDLTGYDLATASLAGVIRADDTARIELNGNDVGVEGVYTAARSFAAANPSWFRTTANTLDIILRNNGGNTAVRVSELAVNADFVAGVPEPQVWGMMIAGFGLTGGAMRRRHSPAFV